MFRIFFDVLLNNNEESSEFGANAILHGPLVFLLGDAKHRMNCNVAQGASLANGA